MHSKRYIGVEHTAGDFDATLRALSLSKLGFEWSFASGAAEEREIVTVRCTDALRRGVPAPSSVGKLRALPSPYSCERLGEIACAAANNKREVIELCKEDSSLKVACRHLHQ